MKVTTTNKGNIKVLLTKPEALVLRQGAGSSPTHDLYDIYAALDEFFRPEDY